MNRHVDIRIEDAEPSVAAGRGFAYAQTIFGGRLSQRLLEAARIAAELEFAGAKPHVVADERAPMLKVGVLA